MILHIDLERALESKKVDHNVNADRKQIRRMIRVKERKHEWCVQGRCDHCCMPVLWIWPSSPAYAMFFNTHGPVANNQNLNHRSLTLANTLYQLQVAQPSNLRVPVFKHSDLHKAHQPAIIFYTIITSTSALLAFPPTWDQTFCEQRESLASPKTVLNLACHSE